MREKYVGLNIKMRERKSLIKHQIPCFSINSFFETSLFLLLQTCSPEIELHVIENYHALRETNRYWMQCKLCNEDYMSGLHPFGASHCNSRKYTSPYGVSR